MAKALSLPPGEVLDRLEHNDPQIAFAVAAAVEEYNDELERWNALYKMLKQLGDLWSQ